jgi:hypothetical protein
MKAIARKRSRKASEAPLFHMQHRSSHEADRELDHLRKIAGILTASKDNSFPLGPAYWIARLREMRVGYFFLPTQLAQISALERCIEGLAERENRDVTRSKCCVA